MFSQIIAKTGLFHAFHGRVFSKLELDLQRLAIKFMSVFFVPIKTLDYVYFMMELLSIH